MCTGSAARAMARVGPEGLELPTTRFVSFIIRDAAVTITTIIIVTISIITIIVIVTIIIILLLLLLLLLLIFL